MIHLSYSRADEILNNCHGKQIAVIGDVMLDRYFWGNVSRISPEAPVPVIDIEKETFHLGGAANVASNLKSLGLEPLLCGVIGEDRSGKTFSEIVHESGINPIGLFADTNRPTTVKTRVIGNNQQIARLDREVRKLIDSNGEKFILKVLEEQKNLSGIIFEDYNKGTITQFLIFEITSFARINNIPVYVDPKLDNFFNYQNVTVFKPNRKEAQQALRMEVKTKEDAIESCKILLQKLNCQNVLLTLGSDGMLLCEKDGDTSSVPTNARHVADVSGAGDTAIATLASAIAGKANIKEAAALANFASGVVCEEPGIVSITSESLLIAIKKFFDGGN